MIRGTLITTTLELVFAATFHAPLETPEFHFCEKNGSILNTTILLKTPSLFEISEVQVYHALVFSTPNII